MRLSGTAGWQCVAMAVALLVTSVHGAPAPRLLSVSKIWDAGGHNAFTDLIRFQEQWYCTFREAKGHVKGNGEIRVLRSSDAATWESAALLDEQGVDLRDPKLSITPDHQLLLLMGGSLYEGTKLLGRQPRVALSRDGKSWSTPRKVGQQNEWLWRITWHKGRAYGVSYGSLAGASAADSEWTLKLVTSTNGLDYSLVTPIAVPSRPNETTLRFLDNDECVALVRREGKQNPADNEAWIGRSHPPYKDWRWKQAAMHVGGPNLIVLPGGSMIAAGRQHNPTPIGAKTFIGRMDFSSITPDLILPSGGDCGYPGMVWHENKLWLSYYSSHEGKASIYLAQIGF